MLTVSSRMVSVLMVGDVPISPAVEAFNGHSPIFVRPHSCTGQIKRSVIVNISIGQSEALPFVATPSVRKLILVGDGELRFCDGFWGETLDCLASRTQRAPLT